MMKQNYMKPATRVVLLKTRAHLLLNSTTVTTNSNNVGLNEEISGGSGPARARSVWDDDWDEE
jgi:hypothetical protein